MKEIELQNKAQLELSVEKKKEIKHELIDKILPYQGHVIWEVNNKTHEVSRAKFSNATYHFFGQNKKEIVVKKDHTYISALNKRNALKKYIKGLNGSKKITNDRFDFPY